MITDFQNKLLGSRDVNKFGKRSLKNEKAYLALPYLSDLIHSQPEGG